MIKYNDESLIRINNQISTAKEFAQKLSELQNPNRDIFWNALKRIIEKSKEGHFLKIRDTLGQKAMEHPGNVLMQVEFMAGAMQAYDEILRIVDKNKEVCDEASEHLFKLGLAKKSIEENIMNQNGGENATKE